MVAVPRHRAPRHAAHRSAHRAKRLDPLPARRRRAAKHHLHRPRDLRCSSRNRCGSRCPSARPRVRPFRRAVDGRWQWQMSWPARDGRLRPFYRSICQASISSHDRVGSCSRVLVGLVRSHRPIPPCWSGLLARSSSDFPHPVGLALFERLAFLIEIGAKSSMTSRIASPSWLLDLHRTLADRDVLHQVLFLGVQALEQPLRGSRLPRSTLSRSR